MTKLKLKIDKSLSSTGKTKWKNCQVDDEIADIVKALQDGEIDMLGSCSGHGRGLGEIRLKDGRILYVFFPEKKGKHPLNVKVSWEDFEDEDENNN